MPRHGPRAAVLFLALLIGAAGVSSAAPVTTERPFAGAALTVPDAVTDAGLHLSPRETAAQTVLAQETGEQPEVRRERSRSADPPSRPTGTSSGRPSAIATVPDGGRLLGLLARPANAPPRS